MANFPVRVPDQLLDYLPAFRKKAKLSQAYVAQRMGITQQTLSALERSADTVTFRRLFQYLHIVNAELVFREIDAQDEAPRDPSKPYW
jgi:HTH-type transcriptional regulator/antitoxin HipB